jgi:hypothetical protein
MNNWNGVSRKSAGLEISKVMILVLAWVVSPCDLGKPGHRSQFPLLEKGEAQIADDVLCLPAVDANGGLLWCPGSDTKLKNHIWVPRHFLWGKETRWSKPEPLASSTSIKWEIVITGSGIWMTSWKQSQNYSWQTENAKPSGLFFLSLI